MKLDGIKLLLEANPFISRDILRIYANDKTVVGWHKSAGVSNFDKRVQLISVWSNMAKKDSGVGEEVAVHCNMRLQYIRHWSAGNTVADSRIRKKCESGLNEFD